MLTFMALQKNVWVDSCSMVAGFRVDSPWISLRERVEALWKNLRFSHRSPMRIPTNVTADSAHRDRSPALSATGV